MSDENDLAKFNNSLGELVNSMSEIPTAFNSIVYWFQEILRLTDDINKLIDHFHKSHRHFVEDVHVAETLKIIKGTIGGCISNTLFESLGHELETVRDLDYNSSIFGQDFKFDYYDSGLPRLMMEVQKQSEIRYPILKLNFSTNDIYKNVPTISFSDWANSVNISVRNSPKSPEKKLILQLLLKDNPDNMESSLFDGNVEKDEFDNIVKRPCSDFVYGHDFIIDPADKNKPKELIELEKELNIPSDIPKIKYAEYLNNCVEHEYRTPIDYTYLSSELDPEDLENEKKKKKEEENSLNQYICTRLVAEWLHNTDIDKNGLIYGTDFVFSRTEPRKCKGLKDIEADIDWNPPENIKIWSFEKYCNTFPDNNPDDRYED